MKTVSDWIDHREREKRNNDVVLGLKTFD